MSLHIVIASRPPDVHAMAVATALQKKGVEVSLWQTADFPSRETESIRIRGRKRQSVDTVDAYGSAITSEPVHTVWNRRPTWRVDEEAIHPADLEFADLQCRMFRSGLWSKIHAEAFWVNTHAEAVRANNKIIQQVAAAEVGLISPETLFSNDPAEIRRFIEACGGQAVFKPMRPMAWRRENLSWWPMTVIVESHSLTSDEALRNAPGIFQERVPKTFEVRLTVMGHSLFGVKLDSQNTERGKLDWRHAYDELELTPLDIPRDVGQRCIELLRSLGLVFGCFDFVVTPDGDWVFLEVNQMGQFLFVERMCDSVPLIDAFTEFLICGRPDFVYDVSRPVALRYRELHDGIDDLVAQSTEQHVKARSDYLDEPG